MAERLGQDSRPPAAAETAAGEGTDSTGSHAATAPRGQGWTLIDGAVIGDAPSPGDLVLVHPGLGLALFQLDAHWTADALARLEQRLVASGFREAFPGRLPAIHRRLRREVIPELPAILDEAFSLQPRMTLPEGGAWVPALRAVLTGAGARVAADTNTGTDTVAHGDAAPLAEAPEAPEPAGMAEAPAPLLVQPAAAASLPLPGPLPTSAPPAANDDTPRAGSLRGLIAVSGAVAAGVLLVLVLRGGPADLPPPAAPAQQVAENTHAATRTDAAPASTADAPPPLAGPPLAGPPLSGPPLSGPPLAGPSRPAAVTAEPRPVPAEPPPPRLGEAQASPPPVMRIAEPPPPRIEVALAAPPQPVMRIAEPPPPRIEVSLAAPLLPVAPPVAPFPEPPAPNIEAALAAAAPPPVAPPVAPFEEPPAPNIAAALAAAAPPPVAPFEEPPAPNIAAALAAAAPLPVAPPVAPFEEPPAPNIAAALAAAPAEGALLPLPEEPPGFDLEAAIRSLGPPPARPGAVSAATAPTPQPAPTPTPAPSPALAPTLAPAPAQAPSQAAAAAPTAQPPVTPLATPDPPAVIGAMLLRGEALMGIGDISGARRFFERAAASGSGAAALWMGATYDPTELARLGARGIAPDRARALAWYRHAERLGEARAAERIATLEAPR